MTIIHPLNDFIYIIFNIEKNKTTLEKALIEFYSLGNIKPIIEFNEEFVSIKIDYIKIETENKQFEKLISFCESRNFEEAKILADKLIKLNPNNSEYYRIQGQIYSELGNQEDAINSLIYSLRWNPKNEWALLMMGNIFAKYQNDIDTAMKYYDQVLIVKPNDCITLNNIGANLMQLNNKKEAIIYFNRALKSDSNYPNTYYGLALVANGDKDYKKAFELSLIALSKTKRQSDQQLYSGSFNLALASAKKIKETINTDKIIKDFTDKLSYLSEKEIKVEIDNSILTTAKIEFAENYDRDYHLIKYKSNHIGIEHLILHELTHLELILEAREENLNELFISNESNKSKFIYSLEKDALKLKKNRIPKENINNYFNALFNGLNNQIFNTPIDLFIEDRIFNKWEEMRPIQFLSLLSILKEGIQANTNKDIVENTPKNVLSKSKIYNIINALHFKDLFQLDLINELKPTRLELNQANEFYSEFKEYRINKAPAEEYELVKNWGEDLGLEDYYELVLESDYHKKTIDSVIEQVENDPLGLNTRSYSNEREMKKFLEENSSEEINMAVAMYMGDAINYFKKIPIEKIKEIAFEIATIGTQGINPNEKNYSIPSIENSSFSGYKILAYYYTSWALAIPEMVKKLQLPFDKEYELASRFLNI
ncbi:tetratricopeptide repeat protein [Tenacibaculum dicentrarchi]|nr:tetratricopeptide repeat protein [Tenacibaculum dicentrarchi]